ncbi:MAG: permease prefix domain 1-containing protein, partial [Acidobacteria bacterium]|nr:permease prefix domain 1-containing protein [Acidobacteriota bacterium]
MPLERWLYAWRARWRALFDRGRADRELDDELRDHVARETAALRTRGIAPAEARRQALASLGGLASAQDRVRAVRFGSLAEQVLQDVRHGLRLLVRNPGFTAATVVTLTVGIGATATVFSVVDAVLLQPPPFPEPGRLVTLWQTDPGDGDRAAEVAPANFLDWRDQATAFERVAAVQPYSYDVTG